MVLSISHSAITNITKYCRILSPRSADQDKAFNIFRLLLQKHCVVSNVSVKKEKQKKKEKEE